MFGTLRGRALGVVTLALIPSFVTLLAIAAYERREGVEQALESAQATAHLVADQQMAMVSSTAQLLRSFSALIDRPVTNTAGCDIGLARLITGTNTYLGLSISNVDGTVSCAAPRRTSRTTENNTDRRFFQRVVATGKVAIGGYQIDRLTARPRLAIGAPIIDRTGQITSVFGASIDLLVLNERLEAARLPREVVIVVTDDAGQVIARHPDATEWIGRDISNTAIIGRIKAEREGTAFLPLEDGAGRWHAFMTVGDPADGTGVLFVDASYTQQVLFAGVRKRLGMNLFGLLGGTVLALGLAWAGATHWISRPVDCLTETAKKLQAGDWSARTGLRAITELGQLGAAVDEMADTIQTHERNLQSLNADLEERVARRSEVLQRTNQRLRISRTELRRLSAELLEISERERARLSREVHDQIGQALTGLKLDLADARRRLKKSDPDAADARVAAAMDLVDETIRLARRIALDLRPSILDDFGLAAALEWQLEDFAKRTGLRHELTMDVDEEVVSPGLATAAFRIHAEALTNIARHASATLVSVRLATDDARLTLVIRDDGRGIADDEQVGKHALGLLGMRERARQLGGRVTFVGDGGQGTVVTLDLPLITPDTVENEEDLHDENTDG